MRAVQREHTQTVYHRYSSYYVVDFSGQNAKECESKGVQSAVQRFQGYTVLYLQTG